MYGVIQVCDLLIELFQFIHFSLCVSLHCCLFLDKLPLFFNYNYILYLVKKFLGNKLSFPGFGDTSVSVGLAAKGEETFAGQPWSSLDNEKEQADKTGARVVGSNQYPVAVSWPTNDDLAAHITRLRHLFFQLDSNAATNPEKTQSQYHSIVEQAHQAQEDESFKSTFAYRILSQLPSVYGSTVPFPVSLFIFLSFFFFFEIPLVPGVL